jgi:hypothetical protein
MKLHTQLIPLFKSVQIISFALALSLILVGCGGGSSSNKSSTPVSTVVSSIAASSTPASIAASSVAVSSTPAASIAASSMTASSTAASVTASSMIASSAATTMTISGVVVAKSADVIAVASLYEDFGRFMAKINPVARVWAAADTGATGNEVLPNANVALVKVFGGANPEVIVNIGIVTTDDTGAYSIPAVEKVPVSEGTPESFYYEVRITKDELTLKTPIAANVDVEANVSPETDLAAKILSEVVAVPGVENPPIPSNQMVESVRELVLSEAADLSDDKAIEIPSALATGFDANSVAAANGLAANGGNAEKLFKAASFSAEEMALVNDSDSTEASATGYINRVIREGCNQAEGDYLPQPIAAAFGENFKAGNKLTATQIVAAYNQNFSGPDIVPATVVLSFKAMLTDVADKLAAPAVGSSDIVSNKQLALYTMRDLDPLTFAADTELDADQALAFIQTLGTQQCQFTAQLDLFGFIADLLDKPLLGNPAIAFADIYHNSGFNCNEGSGKGHFMAKVKVNRNGKTITSVTVASNDSDTTVLGGDAAETLTAGATGLFNAYDSNTDGVCVNLGKEVSYTVTANFSDSTSVTATVDRNHPRIPEASSQVFVGDAFEMGSGNSASPTVVGVSRPLYQWTSPAAMLNLIANDGANTAVKAALLAGDYAVKYTYEFAHVDTGAVQVSPAPQCAQVSSGALYSVDSFNPTADCDVAACATALSVAPSRISCRMNIQSYLVDKNDKILGQAAGHFRFFCVDTDGDDDCG